MSEPICYLNGQWLPATQATVSVVDTGFIHGVTVAEQIRTVNGRPFLLTEHLVRFERGCTLLDIEIPNRSKLYSIVESVIQRNYPLVDSGLDLGVCLFATPGNSNRFRLIESVTPKIDAPSCSENSSNNSGDQRLNPTTLGVHSYVLPFEKMATDFKQGLRLYVVDNEETSPGNWPRGIKVRSRAHYYLAERELARSGRSGVPILTAWDPLLKKRYLRETPTATPLFVMKDGEVCVPPLDRILDSITLQFVIGMLTELGRPVQEREIAVDDIRLVESVFLLNTPVGMVEAISLDEIELERKSEIWIELQKKWLEVVGLDFENQAIGAIRSGFKM